MPWIRDTDEVRAVLREWVERQLNAYWAKRAHEAYTSTQLHSEHGYFITVDERMLEELRRRTHVEKLPAHPVVNTPKEPTRRK